MTVSTFVPVLAMLTLLAVVLFALRSKKEVEDRRADPEAPKSTLATDAPDEREAPASR